MARTPFWSFKLTNHLKHLQLHFCTSSSKVRYTFLTYIEILYVYMNGCQRRVYLQLTIVESHFLISKF